MRRRHGPFLRTVCGACTIMVLADASIGARRTVRCGERHAGTLARARMLAAMHVHDSSIATACAVDVSRGTIVVLASTSGPGACVHPRVA